jgi:hypothetical protein
MTQEDYRHPITPPPELVQQWSMEGRHQDYCTLTESIAARAAQWGADQELEACCAWVSGWCPRWPDGTKPEAELRAARRPKPPSLKEQALEILRKHVDRGYLTDESSADADTIRRALEQLDD